MSDKSKKDWKSRREEHLHQEKQKTQQAHIDPLIDEDLADFSEVPVSLEHPSYPELEEKLTLAEKQAHENWEKATRAFAELENVRRRAERDIENAHKFSLERFVDGLIPVVDSLEQALQLADKVANAAMHEGLELTMKLFLDVLGKFDVTQLNPVGEVFNPTQHEAMSMQASPDAKPNTILMVFQKGYKLYDRVIRPARVIVAK